jgi:hypothetical protein
MSFNSDAQRKQAWPILWRIGIGPMGAIVLGIICKKTEWHYSVWKYFLGNLNQDSADLWCELIAAVLSSVTTIALVYLYAQKIKRANLPNSQTDS